MSDDAPTSRHIKGEDSPEVSVLTQTGDSVTAHAEHRSKGYTVRVERVDPGDDPALEAAGYRSPSTIYMVLGAATPEADHDPHRLVRSLPGDARWLLGVFDYLEAALVADEMPDSEVWRFAVDRLADRSTLTEAQAEAYVLAVVEDHTNQEAADRLGISRQAVDKRLRAARDKLIEARETVVAIHELDDHPALPPVRWPDDVHEM